MSTEKKLIEMIDRILPHDRTSQLSCFESDAQVVRLEGGDFAFSTDGFSHEDLLLETDPYRLGWNVTVGAISDILAVGGVPRFYAHAMSIGRTWDATFVERFSRGIARALEMSGVTFIGGDLGKSAEWKYVASVIGTVEGRPVLRKGASAGQGIYLSGSVGTGNLEAAISLYARTKGYAAALGRLTRKLSLRLPHARVMKKYAACAIDTSDGVFDALSTISEINDTGYIVEDLPYLRQGVTLAKILGLPKSLLFFGGCGEYELLFTVQKGTEAAFLAEAKEKGLRFHRLGMITGGRHPEKVLKEDGARFDLSGVSISARDFDTAEEYLEKLQAMAGGLKCHDESSLRVSGF
jgi:thiamine-monophosphate kinase